MSATEWRKRWGLHTADTLHARVRELGASEYLVKGLLPARSIALLLGDSGLGKSPLVYQLAMCVATGVPFLGYELTQGGVLVADFENGISEIQETVDRLSSYLGVAAPLEELHLWSLNDCEARYGLAGHMLLDILRDVRPTLAIVDSLASYAPEAEEKNSSATRTLQGFRSLARECGTATVVVHHRRKQSRKAEERTGPLEDTNPRQWFQDARGASALINGTDVRLGVDEPDTSVVAKDDVALVLRGFGRVRGEIGPIYIARDTDDNDDACGYRRLVGPELLFDSHRRTAFAKLPAQFTFKDAKSALERADQATKNFLVHCMNLGLAQKLGRGRYEKTRCAGTNGATGERN